MSGDNVTCDHDDQVIDQRRSYTMTDIVCRLKALLPHLGPDMCDPGVAAEIKAVTHDAVALVRLEG